MTPSERLSLAIHQESAAIAPQTSELIEAGKEILRENERLRAAMLSAFDRLNRMARDSSSITRLAFREGAAEIRDELREAFNQQTSVNSEEGK